MNPVYVYRRRHRIVPVASEKARRLGRPVLMPTRTLTRRGTRLGRAEANRLVGIVRSLPHTLAVHGIPVTTNHRRLATLKDRHKGQRCFVIGNGPSLLTSDLDRLIRETTFASNKIYLAFDETDWRPTYYTVEDVLVAQNVGDRINAVAGMPKIFDSKLRHLLEPSRQTMYVDVVHEDPFPRFSTDAFRDLYWGASVTYMNIQLAFFMGCERVYLIGVDFSFAVPGAAQRNVLISKGEQNWFHPDYRPPGERWHDPLLHLQGEAFERAQSFCRNSGRAIINATRGGKLEVFPRVDFDSLFP